MVCCIAAGLVFAFFVGLFRKLRGRDEPRVSAPPPTPRIEVTPVDRSGPSLGHEDAEALVGTRA